MSTSKNVRTFPGSKIVVIVAAILFASLAAYLTFFSKAASSGFYISPSSSSVPAGSTFSVQVRLNYGSPVDTVRTYISYPSNLEVVGLPSEEQPFDLEYKNDVSTPGLIKIERQDFADPSPTGDNIISTITFKAKSAGSATVSFSSADTYGVYQINKITTIAKNSSTYTVINSAPVAPPPPAQVSNPVAPTPAAVSPRPGTPASPSGSGPNAARPGSPTAVTPGANVPPSSPSTIDPITGLSKQTIADASGSNKDTEGSNSSGIISDKKTSPAVVAAIIAATLLVAAAAAQLLLIRKGYTSGIVGYINSLRNPTGLSHPSSAAPYGTQNSPPPGTVMGPGSTNNEQNNDKPIVVTPTPPAPVTPPVVSAPPPPATTPQTTEPQTPKSAALSSGSTEQPVSPTSDKGNETLG